MAAETPPKLDQQQQSTHPPLIILVKLRLQPSTMTLISVFCLAGLLLVQSTGAAEFGWTELSVQLPKAISDHTATRSGDIVYIAGGCDAEEGNVWDEESRNFYCSEISSSFFGFNIVNETLTEALPDMPNARYRHAAVAVNNAIWIVGGRDVDEAIIEEIDVSARFLEDFCFTLLCFGQIIIDMLHFRPSSFNDVLIMILLQVFDITTKTWSTVGTLPEEYLMSDHTGFGWANRYAYFVGGYDVNYTALSTVFSIDGTAADPLSTLTIRSPLIVERGDISSAVDEENGIVLVAGGFTNANNFCEPHAHSEFYNISSDTWKEVAPLENGRADKALVHLQGENGIFYAIGGERQVIGFCELDVKPEPGERTIPIDQVEQYNLTTDKWTTTVKRLPEHRFRFPAVSEGSKVYTFGGQLMFNQTCDCFPTTSKIVVYSELQAAGVVPGWLTSVALSVASSAFLLATMFG